MEPANLRMTESGVQLPLPVSLDVEARFDTFYAGADAHVVQALRTPPAPGVWLVGADGSGRSHLLQALVAATEPGRSWYLPLGEGLPPAVLDNVAPNSIVCLDDLDVVLGEPDWERALLVLYERLLAGGGRLVVSAGVRPAAAGMALEDWRSRCQSLVVFALRGLDDEGLVAALQLRAGQRGLDLPADAARFLARRLPREPGVLFGWLARLDEAALAAKRRLTLRFVREVYAAETQAAD